MPKRIPKKRKNRHNLINGIAKTNIRALFLALLLLLRSCKPNTPGVGNISPEEVGERCFTAGADKVAVFANGSPEGF